MDDMDDYGSFVGSDLGSEEFPEEEFPEEDEDMFMDDSLHEADLEPTEFSESLHVSDLEDDAFPESTEPMPEPVLPPVAEEAGEGGIFGAALKVGALGAVLLASKKFTEFLNKDDDDNNPAEAIQNLQDSVASQSSSSNVVGAAPM